MYTRTCPFACQDCITDSSPQARLKMPFEKAKSYIRAMVPFTPAVCFTGGESLLYPEDIMSLSRYARDLGLRPNLVSGAGWVNSAEMAEKRAKELAEAGIKALVVSWDKYHEEFGHVDQPVLLARAAAEAGIHVSVRIVSKPGECFEKYRKAFENIPVVLQPVPIIRMGRAKTLPKSHFYWHTQPPKGACFVVLSPAIDEKGKVYACCGPTLDSPDNSPLILGDAEKEPLENILERGVKDTLLEMIHLLGPYGMTLLLKEHPEGNKYFKPGKSYSGVCELCRDLTDSPELVRILREQIQSLKSQRRISAARVWMEKKIKPEWEKQILNAV